jgi:hypothetical protein
MQVRAHDERHVLGPHAQRGEAGEEILLAFVELRAAGPRLVGAAAGIDQDGVATGLEHEGMEAHDDLAVGVDAAGQRTPGLIDHLGRRGGKELLRGKRRELQLGHASDFVGSDRQFTHRRSLPGCARFGPLHSSSQSTRAPCQP